MTVQAVDRLSSRLTSLSPQKQALLMQRLKSRHTPAVGNPGAIARGRGTEEAPASFGQERFWFLHEWEPTSLYNDRIVLSLEGDLDVAALTRSFWHVVRRHEVLRTSFHQVEGRLVQRIAPAKREVDLPASLPVVDLMDLSSDVLKAVARKRTNELARWVFDLKTAPLFQVALLRLRRDRHILALTIHHIVTDAWSRWVFGRELAALYEAYSQGALPALPDLGIQYADFARWQREWLNGTQIENQITYWKRQLAEAPTVLEMPHDKPRPASQSYRGRSIPLNIPTDLAKSIKTFATRAGVTTFMILLAAWYVVLRRHSRQKAIVVGAPVIARARPETEPLIGLFIDTLALLVKVNHDARFSEVLSRVKETVLGAFSHKELPFEKLVDELKVKRSASHTPLFQALFEFRNVPSAKLELPGLDIRPYSFQIDTARTDLILSLDESAETLSGAITYSSDLFFETTIERLGRHYKSVLEESVRGEDPRISELSFMSAGERCQLREWNDTGFAPPEATLPALVTRQAARTPHSVAVVCEGRSWTYGELERRSERLARELTALGVESESRVGICIGRSERMLEGLLGIMKAGGAYVPLDPSYPKERLRYIVKDSGMRWCVTEGTVCADLGLDEERTIFLDRLDRLDGLPQGEAGSSRAPLPHPSNLAYCIYTSGSTGLPKGVQIAHGALVNFLASMRERPGLDADDLLLAVTSLSFDIAGLELFLPLMNGARVEVASRKVASDGEALAERLREGKATVMQATPATWRLLLEAGWSSEGRDELRVLCGGEALPPELAAALMARGAKVWNLYGPTETTVWSTAEYLEENAAPNGSVPAIGRPIGNTLVHLVDELLRPVPRGASGELTIGGDGLARGYLGRPGKTAERFVPDPFFSGTGRRLYRTGDLARYSADGRLHYLGRLDHQVKVRGFRIELGEIESVLASHPAVTQAVVVTQGSSGDLRLVAYLVEKEDIACRPQELRAFLKKRLPEYMIPSVFTYLESFPLTPNGKIDRRSLPEPKLNSVGADESTLAPRTATEHKVKHLWEEVLEADRIAITDNFFDVGGHSLLATQLLSRFRQAFGVALPFRSLFEAPTIVEMASLIDREKRQATDQMPMIKTIPRDEELPLSFAQRRLWFAQQMEPWSGVYNINAAVRLHGKLNIPALMAAISGVANRHESLRTMIRSRGKRGVGVAIAPKGPLPLPVIDVTSIEAARGETILGTLNIEEVERPFDMSRDILFRAHLLRLNATEHVLVFVLHHIVSDGWSTGILLREVISLYEGADAGRPSSLPAVPVQYVDYAAWQRRWLAEDVLTPQIEYWERKLTPPLPNLRFGNTQSDKGGEHDAGTLTFRFSEALSGELKSLGVALSATPFTLVLAGLKTLLAIHSGENDIVVGSPIANRNRIDIEGAIGLFLNTLALRTDLSGNPSFRELVHRVQDVTLDAQANQEVPLDMLVQKLQEDGRDSRRPLFQVAFTLQNVDVVDAYVRGIRITPLSIPRRTSEFDLILNVTKAGDEYTGRWMYKKQLFKSEDVLRLSEELVFLFQSAAQNADIKLSDLNERVSEENRKRLETGKKNLADLRLKKFQNARRRSGREQITRGGRRQASHS